MSDVEKLFYKLQEELAGSGSWHQLNPQYQQVFIQAINNIRGICSLKQGSEQ